MRAIKPIILETAHPVKFPESVEKITRETIPYPSQVEKIMGKVKKGNPTASRLFIH
jgi:threonine synthase